jgi:5-methylcytosine-specific restriction enzyme subunit McrC
MSTEVDVAQIGTVSKSGIPIRNIWYLMAYAANETAKLNSAHTSSDAFFEDLPDLVARLLVEETRLRIWGNLTVGYRSRQIELPRLRGTISHIQTARRNSFTRGQIVCRYEEITLDTTENKLVRTALGAIAALAKDDDVRLKCKATEKHMESLGVGLLPQRGGLVSLGRIPANPRDARMCALAVLALQMEIPSQEAGRRSLYSPEIVERWLQSLFEKAVLGFYRYHLGPKGWSVKGGRILKWHSEDSSSGLSSILPSMKTDIELTNQVEKQKTVIDTKFASILAPGRVGVASLRSGYIYQLYAYLRSQEDSEEGLARPTTGILLHPSVGYSLYEETIIQGHRFRFATVDLLEEPKIIEKQLLTLILEE